MDDAPYHLVRPRGHETPLVVEVPHAGLLVPAQYALPLSAPIPSIARDADLYVDELYEDAPLEGATLLVARMSRYVIDLNRSEQDVDEAVIEHARSKRRLHHGLIWRSTTDGHPAMARPLRESELIERLDRVYRPYHRALRAELVRKQSRFGVAVLLAAHSMPSVGPSATNPEPIARADVVPGSRGRTTAAERFLDLVEAHARLAGWSVRHDDPYSGGFSTRHYGSPKSGLHAVQIELARRLYLNENTLRKTGSFDHVQTWCRQLTRAIGELALSLRSARR
jgi:N-formylglutamate amidohydrolase